MNKDLSEKERRSRGLLINKIGMARTAFLDLGNSGPILLEGLCLPVSKRVRKEIKKHFGNSLQLRFRAGEVEVRMRKN